MRAVNQFDVRSSRSRKAALVGVASLILSLLSLTNTSVAVAAKMAAPTTIDTSSPGISTCVNIKTGAMRYVPSGACAKKTEKKVSWSNFSFKGNPLSPKLVGCVNLKTRAMRLLLKGACVKSKETALGWANFRTKGLALPDATKNFLTVSTVLYACANLKTGALRLLPQGKTKCTAKKEKAIHWSNIPLSGDGAFSKVDSFESLNVADPLPELGDTFLVIGDLYTWDGKKWIKVGTLKDIIADMIKAGIDKILDGGGNNGGGNNGGGNNGGGNNGGGNGGTTPVDNGSNPGPGGPGGTGPGNPIPVTPETGTARFPIFVLSSTSETRTVSTAATGFTINSSGPAITSFAIAPAAPAGMTFNTTTGALTGTPTTVAPTTVYTVTATNAAGSTSRTFTFTVIANPPTVVSINVNSATRLGGTAITITGTGFLPGAKVTFDGLAASNVTVVSTTSITATTPPHAVGTVDVVVTNTDAGVGVGKGIFTYAGTSCTGTSTCGVGDTGPGGGTIYFYDPVGFSCGATYSKTGSPTGGLCNYLEIAPNSWKGGSADPTLAWALNPNVNSAALTSPDGSINNSATGLGRGYKNSIEIVAQGNDVSTAAGAARAYQGGTLKDWYLPSTAELNLACQWARGVKQDVTAPCLGGTLANGGFASSNYWSSSEHNVNQVWLQPFNNQYQGDNGKNSSVYVRPIRAFGGPANAPAFTLSSSSETVTVNTAAIGETVTSTGGGIVSFTITPAAPAGMTFDTATGTLSGTPTTVTPATAYTITGTNTAGSASKTFTLIVAALPTYAVGTAGPGGGKIFYVSTTPFACGPTLAATCNYLEVAPSGWSGAGTDPKLPWSGNTTTAIGTAAQGTVLGTGYKNTLAMVAQDATANKAGTVSRAYTGGGVNDWFLPSQDELNLLYLASRGDSSYGFRSGVETYWTSTEFDSQYAWDQLFDIGRFGNGGRKANAGSSVRPIRAFSGPTPALASPLFTLSTSSETVTVNAAATGFTVTSTGGAVASFAISPAAPAGMTFNASTGAFSGTPTTIAAATVYTVTGTNATGSYSKSFTLIVALSAPLFTLSSTSETTTVNVAATGFTVTSTGGTVASYAISPAAPAGMTFNTTTGALSGTPTAIAPATAYTVTATNASGSSTKTFTFTVAIAAPAFALSSSSETRVVNTAATGFTVTSTGGTVASYAISPAAPAGMTFSTTTGALSGTPTAIAPATVYTVTATNASGSATKTFTFTVNVTAPAFTLTASSETATATIAATGFTATSTGGAIASYAISPAAPTGMTFNTTTGVLSGTPANAAAATLYTVTATNVTGSATQSFTLTVKAYVTYTVGSTGPGGGKIFYASATPFACGPTLTDSCNYLEAAPNTWSGGTADTRYPWSNKTTASSGDFGPAQGIGAGYKNTLAIVAYDPAAGIAARAARNYTVTVGGTVVSDWYLPSKNELELMYTKRATIGGFTADRYWGSSDNGPVFAWGVGFADSGALTGSMTYQENNTFYIRPIRAFSGPVAPLAAPAFTISAASESVATGSVAVGFTATSTGGEIASFAISPAAPAGMNFNTTTGALSGTPSAAAAATPYTVTATNATGSATRTFTLTITAPLTCAQGGVCVVGDIGPGGGKVFYVKAAGFACGTALATTCKYLEAAPNTWFGGSADPTIVWSTNTSTAVGASATGTAIGTGSKNTYWIADRDPANVAAMTVMAYRGGGKSDWYLPSTDELNALYLQRTTQGTLTNLFSFYWSSTELDARNVTSQDFGSGFVGPSLKTFPLPVRAIRAF